MLPRRMRRGSVQDTLRRERRPLHDGGRLLQRELRRFRQVRDEDATAGHTAGHTGVLADRHGLHRWQHVLQRVLLRRLLRAADPLSICDRGLTPLGSPGHG